MGEIEKFEDSVYFRALKANQARYNCFTEAYKKQREWCANRFTSDIWLAENKREWDALDRVCRSRPWAKNRDKGFEYPFAACSDEMRKAEGPWCGDEKPKVKDTRGEHQSDVVTQVVTPTEYPPDWRVILFTPEFGSTESFDLENWSYLEPEGEVDVWVICWQGWEKWDEMIEQVLNHVLSFGDGSSTIWFAEGLGGLVAYEVAKAMEKHQASNFPYGLVLSNCPAPNLFASVYKPYEMDDWDDNLANMPPKQKKIVKDEVRFMKSYLMNHGKGKRLCMPVKAFYHEGNKFGIEEEHMAKWGDYSVSSAKKGGFELMTVLDEDEMEGYISGKHHAYNVDPAIVSIVSELGSAHPRFEKNPQWPDIGDTDGPIPEEVGIVSVGLGVQGCYQAMEFKKNTNKTLLVVDRSDNVGGVWHHYGNDYSRVNSSEVAYRFVDKEGLWKNINEDHTPKRDIMMDMYRMCSTFQGDIRFHMDVVKVVQRDDFKFEVTMKHLKRGTEHKVICDFVSLHVNRRIGRARDVDWDNSANFKGKICYGYRNEMRGLSFWNKDVCIVGAGAFAFENVRSAVEHGCHFCTLLGRRDGTTSPKWIDMISFLRPMDQYCTQNRVANAISFEVWQRCYETAGLHTPACWKEGLLKPNNHTVSVSDLAYIAGFHGLFDVKVGEIRNITDDGKGVELKNGGERMDLDLIIKCTGFHLNNEVEKITGHDKMYPSGLIKFNLNYGAEPLLDGAQFGSAKGHLANEDTEAISEEQFRKGFEVFQEKKFDPLMMAPMGNPFGSGAGGPTRYLSKYMAWLVNNPDCQKAMIELSGRPEQNVVEFWASSQGRLLGTVAMRTVAALADYAGA